MPKPQWATARWLLKAEAQCWRFLMDIGMSLHRLAPPRPMRSSFTLHISSTFATRPGGDISLVFYVPDGYAAAHHHSSDSDTYPVMVNFHGGGMTIGRPEDDATWATAVVRETQSVVVCVGYRLAPDNHFPVPVEDGTDAILYLVTHAARLRLDVTRITVSGFSSGGNLCFTVPLMLSSLPQAQQRGPGSGILHGVPYTIIAIIAFYPSVNFTTSRQARRRTNTRQDRNLAEFFTDLFDASYLYPAPCPLHSPYLSPAVAPRRMLEQSLARHVLFYTAEWDELQAEAAAFADTLLGLGKRVRYRMLQGQVHAWDRGTNPFRQHPLRGPVYREACTTLNRLLQGLEMEEQDGEALVSDLHLVEQVNVLTHAYMKDKAISQVQGTSTPRKPSVPELVDTDQDKRL